MPRSVVVHDEFDWGPDGDPPLRRRWRDTADLRAARQGLHPAAPGDPRGAPWHVRRPRPPDRDPLPQRARRHRRRAPPDPPVLLRASALRARPGQLLGLQLPRLLRPARGLLLLRRPRPAGHRVQADGQGVPRGGHRGDPRRGLQPHRRGSRHRAVAVVPRSGRSRHVQAGPDRSRAGRGPARARRLRRHLLGRHGLRQHRQRRQSPGAAADPGLAALLGHRDARRRLPLRPALGADPVRPTPST